jgi:potassium-dependent mechanosensitive channel
MKFGPIIRALSIVVAVLFLATTSHAFDEALLNNAETAAQSTRSDLERVQNAISQTDVADDQLATQRNIIEKLRLDSLAQVNALNAPLKDFTQQLNQLGPVPTQDHGETSAIAAQRQSLNNAVARLSAAQKQFELLGIEAEQTTGKISALQRTQFLQRVFKPDKSIFNPQLWIDTATGVASLGTRLSSLVSGWWQSQSPMAQWTGLGLLPAFFLILAIVYRFSKRMMGRWLNISTAPDIAYSPLRRLGRVVGSIVIISIILLVSNFLLTTSISLAGLSTPRFDLLVTAFASIVIPVIFQSAVAYLICAPGKPQLRLVAIDEAAARTVPIFVALCSIVQNVSSQISFLSDQLLLPLSLVAGQSALASTALIFLVGLLLLILKQQSRDVPSNVPEPHYLTWFVQVSFLQWLLLIIAVFGLVFGYLALAYFIASKILDTLLVIILMVLVHHLVDSFVEAMQDKDQTVGKRVRALSGFSERGIGRLALAIRTLSDILVVILGIPWLFAIWTLTWISFKSLLSSAIVGVRFGNFYISPINILGLIALFAVGVLITKFITSWLDRRVLTQTKLNKGVQNSVKTGANYFGYILAAALALSAGGFDFSSFTIIAGALGVGIGFGLQSIVNNFVSGLILLAERPVRVGDWVVVAAGEGIVKKINVRSTEIETFDNCTIIVPNSLLITEAVRNWTHRDTLGRFLVTIGVDHSIDAEHITKVLKELVVANSKVLRYPPPIVQLARFSPATLDFEIRGHVADVFEGPQVASDIRTAITKKFAELKIIIPTYLELPIRK